MIFPTPVVLSPTRGTSLIPIWRDKLVGDRLVGDNTDQSITDQRTDQRTDQWADQKIFTTQSNNSQPE